MSLFLVQHGQSVEKDVDAARPLSETGVATVTRMAAVARDHHVHVSSIIHSGKTRACQTADILAAALHPSEGVRAWSGLDPHDDVTVLAERLRAEENRMIVGHLPFLERLLSFLTTGNPDSRVLRFQNGCIVCLDRDREASTWYIKWTLMPDVG